MPLLDLSPAELQTYAGRNPRPGDFDAYWERGLAEMRATDPCVRVEAHDLPTNFAECLHLTFTGVGGAQIYAKLLRPRKLDQPAPALLMFHGYSGNSGDWNDKLAHVANGTIVLAMDCRGQGGRSEDAGAVRGNTQSGHIIRGLDDEPDRLLFRQVFLDTAMLARIALEMPEVDPARVWTSGASQGGGLSLACAALEPRVSKAVAWYPFLCDYQRVWEMDQAANAYAELRSYFRLFDPRHEREAEVFEKLGYIDVQHLAPRVRAHVLMAVGLMDAVTPPSTQYAAYNKLQCPKNAVHYPDFGHEGLPGFGDIAWRFLYGPA
jgi:cephalosporin-C deacetylase